MKEFYVSRKKNDEEAEKREIERERKEKRRRRSRERRSEDDDKEEGQTCRDKTGDARGWETPEKSNPHSSGL